MSSASKKRAKRIPKLRLHKSSGRAFVEIKGRRYYLGKYGTPEAEQRYHAMLAEVAAHGAPLPRVDKTDITVAEVAAAYWDYAKAYYSKKEAGRVQRALQTATDLYGDTNAVEFGPRALAAVRQVWIENGNARPTCNALTQCVKRAFRWAGANELVPGEVVAGLNTLDGLRRGRSDAYEPDPVKPVPLERVNEVLGELSPTVRAMVQFQLKTAARPGEIVKLAVGDIDKSGDVWTAKLSEHKTGYLGRERVLYIGPLAQDLIRDRLLRPSDDPLFVNSQGAAYMTSGYHAAIRRACVRLEVDRWSPNQLRHTAATLIREQYGLEAAQVILGHARADVTQVYAERDKEKAIRIALEVG